MVRFPYLCWLLIGYLHQLVSFLIFIIVYSNTGFQYIGYAAQKVAVQQSSVRLHIYMYMLELVNKVHTQSVNTISEGHVTRNQPLCLKYLHLTYNDIQYVVTIHN